MSDARPGAALTRLAHVQLDEFALDHLVDRGVHQ